LVGLPVTAAELVAHWTFDEGIKDAFGATTTAFAGAAITGSDAKVGPGCLALQNSYLVVDPTPSLDTPEFTMAFWIYYDSSYQKHTLRQTGRAGDSFETGYDGDQLLLCVNGQTPSWASLYQPVKMDEWVHYAYVCKDGKLTAYENAIQVYQRSIDLSGRKGKQLIIGAGGGVLKDPDYYRQYALKGKIDDLRIYDGALGRAAIQAMVPAQLACIRLADTNPENNTDPHSCTNQTEALVTFDGSSGPHRPTVHLAADPDFKTGCATETWTAERNTFGYSLSGPDGVKTVYARLETKPGEYGPVVSTTITLDTVPPRVESVEVNGGQPHTTTAHVDLKITASDGGAMKARVRDNGSKWTGWKEFLAHLSYRLGKENGKHALEVQVCDNAGNVSPDVVSDSITLQLVPSLREHRNLYNIDFGTYFWKPDQVQPEGGPFKAESIHRFVRLLAGSGTDTYVINPNSKVPWYPSKVTPTILTGYVRDDPKGKTAGGYGPDMLNLLLDLQESDVDWLAESIRACRQCGISPWASVRMNDPHGGAPHMESPLHKDPKYRLGGLLNYRHKEVRDYYFAIIRELVEDYDFDGLELDWKRSAVCIPPPASQKDIDIMTAWFSEIRKLTQARAGKTGRPFYLGMHVPCEYKKLRYIGIDVEAIAKTRLIDFLCPTNFMQTAWDMPHDRIKAELGPELTIYGVTEYWIKAKGRLVCDNPPALRGNAAGKLVLGADGIEQYNFFWAEDYARAHPAMHNLHDLPPLRGQTKHYALSRVGAFRDKEFDRVVSLPATLEPGRRRTFRLPMCAEPTDRDLKLTIQVVIQKITDSPKIGVSFNGRWPNYHGQPTDQLLFPTKPRRHQAGHQAYDYRFDVNEIIEGWNEIVLTNSGSQPARIVSLELAVQHHSIAQD